MWPGTAVVRLTVISVLESLQLRAAKIISPNSGLDDKELNATLGVVPLINKRKLHIVFLARNCLDGSVPPSQNNYFNLNTSMHTFTTRRFNDIHLPKLNLEVAKRSLFSQERWNLMVFLD